MNDSFGARSKLTVAGRGFEIFRLSALARNGIDITRLPYSLRILLEDLLRTEDGVTVTREDIEALAGWSPAKPPLREIAFTPARVLLQDFTGFLQWLIWPRCAMPWPNWVEIRPGSIRSKPVELVVDHSVQVDAFGTSGAFLTNVDLDYQRNRERYQFLRWGQRAFDNFRVVPPNTGIVHQVNLEYLARVVFTSDENPTPRSGELPRPTRIPWWARTRTPP
jgi:aconitate hydratase